jgi:hypothetical protein
MSLRAAIQPVSGTFELRWQGHRGNGRPAGVPEAPVEPGAVSRDGDAPAPQGPSEEPEMASVGTHLDEVPRAP